MSRKVWLVVGSLLLITVLLVTGCAQPAPAPAPAPAPRPAPKPAPAPAPAPKIVPAPITLKFAGYCPESLLWSQCQKWFVDEFARRTEEATGQKVNIEYHWAGTLLGALDISDGVGRGMADFGQCNLPYAPGKFPLSLVTALPFLSPNIYGFIFAHNEMVRDPRLVEECAAANIRIASAGMLVEPLLWTRDKKIERVTDMIGLRVRSLGKEMAWALEALGAAPVSIAYAEQYGALDRGVTSGSMICLADSHHTGVYELCKYATAIGYTGFGGSHIIMNLDTYNSFSDEAKKILEDLHGEYTMKTVDLSLPAYGKHINEYREKGIIMTTLPDIELQAFRMMGGKPAWERWVNQEPALAQERQGVLDTMLSLCEKNEAIYSDHTKYPTAWDQIVRGY